MKTKSSRAGLLGAVLFGMALAPATVSATLLVGFNSFTAGANAPDEGSFAGSLNAPGATSVGGSNDGFYGPDSLAAGGVPVNTGTTTNGRIDNANGTTLTVTNATSSSFVLTNLLFDAIRIGSTGTGAFSVNWSAPGGTGSQSGTLSTPSPVNNFNDYIVNLGGLLFAPSDSIVFTWVISGGSELDNIALIGIPEPGSLLALGCLVGSGLFLRSRSRRKVVA